MEGNDEKFIKKNLSWVTVENTDVKVTVKDENEKEVFTETVKGTSNEKVYTYTSEVKGLKASSKYTYTLENLSNVVKGEFRTAAPKGTEGKVRFARLADPQIADATREEATGAIFKQLIDYSKESPFDFLYIAGDHTDRGADEDQWQALFHNGGLFPNATQDFLLKNTLHSTQGNHDAIDFKGHINTPDEIDDNQAHFVAYKMKYENGQMVKERRIFDEFYVTKAVDEKPDDTKFGWVRNGDNWNYYDKDGSQVKSVWRWAPLLDEDGNPTTKFNWKYFDSKGNSIKQIYTENGSSWLSVTGPMRQYHKGWWTNPSNGYTYFFRLTTGTMAKGEQFINGTWRFFRKSGTMATGWQLVNGTWKFYRIGTGTRVSGLQFIDGSWREFAKDGSLIK